MTHSTATEEKFVLFLVSNYIKTFTSAFYKNESSRWGKDRDVFASMAQGRADPLPGTVPRGAHPSLSTRIRGLSVCSGPTHAAWRKGHRASAGGRAPGPRPGQVALGKPRPLGLLRLQNKAADLEDRGPQSPPAGALCTPALLADGPRGKQPGGLIPGRRIWWWPRPAH